MFQKAIEQIFRNIGQYAESWTKDKVVSWVMGEVTTPLKPPLTGDMYSISGSEWLGNYVIIKKVSIAWLSLLQTLYCLLYVKARKPVGRICFDRSLNITKLYILKSKTCQSDKTFMNFLIHKLLVKGGVCCWQWSSSGKHNIPRARWNWNWRVKTVDLMIYLVFYSVADDVNSLLCWLIDVT